MQGSAFKVHPDKNPSYNVLKYFMSLKLARSKLFELKEFSEKEKKDIKGEASGKANKGLWEIFRIKRRQGSGKLKYPFKIVRSFKPKTKKLIYGNKGLSVLTVELIRFFYTNKGSDLSLDYVSEQLCKLF